MKVELIYILELEYVEFKIIVMIMFREIDVKMENIIRRLNL